MECSSEKRATVEDRRRRTERLARDWAVRIGLPLIALLAAEVAQARPPYLKAWRARYPDSASESNFLEAGGQACYVCHAGNNTPPPGALRVHASWNSYGWSLRRLVLSGSTIEEAFEIVEPFNADQDPGGASNLQEIQADAQPGWTYGPYNETFWASGDFRSDSKPPQDYLGDLNPPGAAYCETAPNSTGERAVLWSSGSSVVEENVFTLHATQVPDTLGVFFCGEGRLDMPFGRGTLCVGGPLSRFPPVQGRANAMTLKIDFEEAPPAFVAGSTWHFQTWYSDRAGGPPYFNTSSALAITFR